MESYSVRPPETGASTQQNALEIQDVLRTRDSSFRFGLRSIQQLRWASLSEYTPVEGHLGDFQIFAVMRRATLNVCIHAAREHISVLPEEWRCWVTQ